MAIMPKIIFILSTAIITLAMGLFVVEKRRTAPNVAFFSLCLSAAMISISVLAMDWQVEHNRVPLSWHNFYDTSAALFLLSTVFFATMFPSPLPQAKKIWLPFSIFTVFISVISILGLNFSEHIVSNRTHTFKPTIFFYIYNVYGLSSLGTMIGVLVYKYFSLTDKTENEHARRALRTVVIWFPIATVIGLFFSFIRVIFYQDMTHFYLMTIGFLIGISATFYSVVRYNAFDIETVLHKTLSWVALSSGPLVLVYGAAVWIKPILDNALPWETAGMIGGIATLIGLYLYTAQPYIDQLFDRRKYNLQHALDEVIGDIAVLQELHPMAEKILERLRQVLTVQGGVAMIFDGLNNRLVLAASKGYELDRTIEIEPATIQRLELGTILELDPIHGSEQSNDITQKWLTSQSFALCLPLVRKGELIGILAFGRKRNLQKYSTREITFLMQIGTAVSIAFSNSLLLERVRELDRLKTEFLSEVAHELGSPLSGLASIAEGILNQDAENRIGDQKRMIENIRITAVEMKDLVDHLLDLSKIEMDVMNYDFQPVDISSVIRLAVDLALGAIRAKRLELHLEIEDELPLVRADKARIRQCVSNLLTNAIKYTDKGEIRIQSKSTEGGIYVIVEDMGRGMTTAERQTIFDRFKRGKRVDGIEGSGLGLTLTKEIIEAHGGNIQVKSEVGVGSVFSLYLPLSKQEGIVRKSTRGDFAQSFLRKTQNDPLIEANGSESGILRGNGERVLVIDDSETERDLLRSFLERNGYTVQIAVDGLKGMELLQVEKPHLIITDMVMPNLSGPDLCRILKADPLLASIPIIMLTGRNNFGDMEFGIETGADDYIAKPFIPKELSLRIAPLLRMQRIRNDLDLARACLIEMELIATSSGTLAHAIKNPLVIIQNFVKITRTAVLAMNHTKAIDGLDQIYSSAGTIAEILQGLRKAHIDPPNMVSLNLSELLDSCEIEALGDHASAKYQINKRYEVSSCIDGDPQQLRMAFTNLLVNALEAMPEGGRITFTIYNAEEGVGVEISDSGPGIIENLEANLFKPFFTTKTSGTGLGLWTAKRVIEINHHGSLSLESMVGTGTTAKIWFPITRQQPQKSVEVAQNG